MANEKWKNYELLKQEAQEVSRLSTLLDDISVFMTNFHEAVYLNPKLNKDKNGKARTGKLVALADAIFGDRDNKIGFCNRYVKFDKLLKKARDEKLVETKKKIDEFEKEIDKCKKEIDKCKNKKKIDKCDDAKERKESLRKKSLSLRIKYCGFIEKVFSIIRSVSNVIKSENSEEEETKKLKTYHDKRDAVIEKAKGLIKDLKEENYLCFYHEDFGLARSSNKWR